MKFKKIIIGLCLVFVLGIISSCDVDDTETSSKDETSEIETVDTNEVNDEIEDEDTDEDESKAGAEENKTVVQSKKVIYVSDSESNSFINAFNSKYPDEKITEDQITEYNRGSKIKINDNITYEVGESDGSTVYFCYGYMNYSEKNKKNFFEYVDRMINLGIYNISYEFSDDFPTSEHCYDEDQKLYIWYYANENGTEKKSYI